MQPGCSSPIDGVLIDWWAPPSGASVTPGRSADQDRLPAGVDAERPRFERALDERVVHDSDRDQRLAPSAPGRAELADAGRPGSSRRCRARCAGRSDSRASAGSSRCRRRTSSAARRSTRRRPCSPSRPGSCSKLTSGLMRHDAGPDLGRGPRTSSSARPSAAWVVAIPVGVRPRSAGTRSGRDGRFGRALEPGRRGGAFGRRGGTGCEPGPAMVQARRPTRPARSAELRRRSAGAEWFCGWPSLAQAVALDRVGEDDGRPGVVDRAERVGRARADRGRPGCGWPRAARRR